MRSFWPRQLSGVVYGLDPDHGGEILVARQAGRCRCERRWRGRLGHGGGSPQLVVALSGSLAQPAIRRQPVGAGSQNRHCALAHAVAHAGVFLERGPVLARAIASGHGHAGRLCFRDRWTGTYAPIRPSTAKFSGTSIRRRHFKRKTACARRRTSRPRRRDHRQRRRLHHLGQHAAGVFSRR